MPTTRKEWEKELKRFGRGVRLPSGLLLDGDERSLRVVLPADATTANMQSDKAAFEAWCLALHVAGARRITLSWSDTLGKDGHSNRFRHRVTRFGALFRDWFEIDPSLARTVYDPIPPRRNPADPVRWVLNVESRPRESEMPHGRFSIDASEHDLELAISTEPVLSRLKERLGLLHLGRQLPVGTFDGRVSGKEEAAVFTAKKSAIDLWGLGKDGRLVLFELKNRKNKKAGALSELFFYATLMREVQKQKGNVRFDDRPKLPHFSYQNIEGTSGIDAYILAPSPHPLLVGREYSVLRELNAAFEAAGEPIRVGVCTFDASGTFSPIEVPQRPLPDRALGS